MRYHVVHRSVSGDNPLGELSNKTDTKLTCGRTLTNCGGDDDYDDGDYYEDDEDDDDDDWQTSEVNYLTKLHFWIRKRK